VILSKLLTQAASSKVLNAHEIATEAEIVMRRAAGRDGRHNILAAAPTSAGPGVAEAGGLHVAHRVAHSHRIDRQLMGRCGRQGDPGTVRQYMSLDDDVTRTGFGPATAEKLISRGLKGGANPQSYLGLLKRAQRKVERRHLRDRMTLLHHEKERKKMQAEMGQDPYLDTPD
jgi:preprotein translocase subunit SecA